MENKNLVEQAKKVAIDLDVKIVYCNSNGEFFTSRNLADLSDEKKNIVTYDFTNQSAEEVVQLQTETTTAPLGNQAPAGSGTVSSETNVTGDTGAATSTANATTDTGVAAKETNENTDSSSDASTEFDKLKQEHVAAIGAVKTAKEIDGLLNGYEKVAEIVAAAKAAKAALKNK